MNIGKMTTYEFYHRAEKGRDHFLGTLLERRKDPARITEKSVLNWMRGFLTWMSDDEFGREIYFREKII